MKKLDGVIYDWPLDDEEFEGEVHSISVRSRAK